MVARGTRRPSGGSREWRRWWVALEMVMVMQHWWRRCGWMMVDGAAAGDGDGEDGWRWLAHRRAGLAAAATGGGEGGVRGMEMPGLKGDHGCC